MGGESRWALKGEAARASGRLQDLIDAKDEPSFAGTGSLAMGSTEVSRPDLTKGVAMHQARSHVMTCATLLAASYPGMQTGVRQQQKAA